MLLVLGAFGGLGTLFAILSPPAGTTQAENHAAHALTEHLARVWLTWEPGETTEQRKSKLSPYWPNIDFNDWAPPEKGQSVRELLFWKTASGGGIVLDTYLAFVEQRQEEVKTEKKLLINVPVIETGDGYAPLNVPTILPAPEIPGMPVPSGTLATEEVAEVAKPFVETFIRAYIEKEKPADIAAMLAPGAAIRPLGGYVAVDSIKSIAVYDAGGGTYQARVEVLVRDRDTNVKIPAHFRVDLVRDKEGRLAVTRVRDY